MPDECALPNYNLLSLIKSWRTNTGTKGIEPMSTDLESVMLPLHQVPIFSKLFAEFNKVVC